MEFKNVGRNDLCPCGSGKKFKRCHLGKESEIVEARFDIDPINAADRILGLPLANHPRAIEMAAELELKDRRGRAFTLKLVDLAEYQKLGLAGQKEEGRLSIGGVLINPSKTEKVDPTSLYIALSPGIRDSDVVHLLAHAVDLVSGSRLDLGRGLEVATELNLTLEFLEHPQEFGDQLVALSEQFGVELDAENEVIAFLARNKKLIPAKVIAKAQRKPLENGIAQALMFLNAHQEALDAVLRSRSGYTGASAVKKEKAAKA